MNELPINPQTADHRPQTVEHRHSRFAFLKKKKFWIPGVIVLFLVGWYVRARSANQGPFYDTKAVVRGTVTQTVEVTGEIKPDARIDLAFKGTGKIKKVDVTVGKAVKQGDVLVEMEARDAAFAEQRAGASLAAAQANLNARLAGETKESIAMAQASYDKAVSDLAITRTSVEEDYRLAQIAFDKAASDLANQGKSGDESVANAYTNLRTTLQTSLNAMQNAQTDADGVIGVDNTAANDNFENVLGVYDRPSLEAAKQLYPTAKAARLAADTAIRGLGANPTRDQVKSAGTLAQYALQQTELLLDYVQKTLAGTIANANLTDTELSSKKTTIGTDRTSVDTQLSAVSTGIQALTTTELSRNTTLASLQSAYDTAKANLATADRNRTTKVESAQIAVAIQQAALDAKKAPPRAVDIAALRAQVSDAATAWQQAKAALDDTKLVAPVDGIVTDLPLEVGEQASPAVTAASMIGTDGYTIEALVPEADIAKVEPGQRANVTLDAYGDSVAFAGTVLAENPDQTKVQDAIYYKTYVQVDAAGHDVKPGMTANVTITTGVREGVLIVPTRGLRERDGKRYVRILDGATVREADVDVGLRGDEGQSEAVSGVSEGDRIIIGELTAAEYKKQQAAQ